MAFQLHTIGQPQILPKVLSLLKNWDSNEDFLFHSSGTTGQPKPIWFTKAQLVSSANATIAALNLNPNEHILLCIDPSFVGGAMMLIRALVLGCEITVIEPSSNLWESIPKEHPFTFASFVPLQLLHPSFDTTKFNNISKVLIGGAAIPVLAMQRLEECSNEVYHTYGMTETLSHVALKKVADKRGYTPLKNYHIRLNEAQCICVKVPFLDNEIITHDVAEMEADGCFQILGRSDFIINSGGVKIAPEVIEKCIEKWQIESNNLALGLYIVGGKQDAKLGEEVVLITEKLWGPKLFGELQTYLKNELHKYQVPKECIQIFPFLQTTTGKPAREAIKNSLKIN
jgi:O-succinylbenzoic acid--CoA ligase